MNIELAVHVLICIPNHNPTPSANQTRRILRFRAYFYTIQMIPNYTVLGLLGLVIFVMLHSSLLLLLKSV